MGRVERAFIVWLLFCLLVYMAVGVTWLWRNGSVFPITSSGNSSNFFSVCRISWHCW